MSLPREAQGALDAIGEHPALVALAAEAPPGIDVPAVARSVARRLVGTPLDREDPLASLLFAIAGAELSLLAGACRDNPLQAVVATVALLAALIPRYPGEPPDERRGGPGRPDRPATQPDRPDRPGRRRLRDQLQALGRQPLPPGFPLPRVDPSQARDPVRLAASLADAMGVDGAASAAWAELERHEDTLDALSRLVPGFGWDFSPGELSRVLVQDLPSLASLLARLPALQRICDQLGRLEDASRKRSLVRRGGRSEVVGVRVGGELSDVLPVELALLGEPATEDLFYQRFVERRLMSLELRGNVRAPHDQGQKRGPIIACVDTSGSMSGPPEEVAKALVLAVTRQGHRQRRPVRLLLFGGPGEIIDHDLRPGRGGLSALVEFLAMGFSAGTDFDGPLRRAVALLDDDAFDRADILVVTDGYGRAGADTRDELAAARRSRGFRVLSVVVGDPHGVADFSDEVWIVDPDAGLPCGLDVRTWRPSESR